MPQIGPMEILVVAVVALIVFGPQRLPEIARTIGKTLNEFRRQAADIRSEFESGLKSMDPMADDDDEPGPAANRPVALDNASEEATGSTAAAVPALEPPEASITDERPDADVPDDDVEGAEDAEGAEGAEEEGPDDEPPSGAGGDRAGRS